MLLHPLTNFEIQKFYHNKPNFNAVYSRDNLPKIKDRTYVVNLYEYELVGTHWIALYANGDNITYVDSFEVEYITKEIKKFIVNKIVMTYIYRSIMCGYFWLDLLISC